MGKPMRKHADRNTFNKKMGSSNPDRPKPDVGSRMRSKATINRIKMYKGGKPIRNEQGKIIIAAEYQKKAISGEVARVEPNRKWFGNTKVISQTALQKFQEEMGKAMSNPYKVIMKKTQLPLSLLDDRKKTARVHLLDTDSFDNTFGPKAQRKRPVIVAGDLEGLVALAEESQEKYTSEKDLDLVNVNSFEEKNEIRDRMFSKGQSKRIWNELYKVIDSSDVVIQVLDARDPNGTRSKHIETFLKNEKKHKHLIFILNKCDLVPTWVTRKWVALLSTEYPTLAFHASVNNPFGKGALIQLLRQFGKLHQDKKNISVGFIGYPNVGKSSIINTLKKKKVCKAAPVPGETKVWQYVTLMRRIYLIDCPGVVYPSDDSETDIVLKGVVRVENLKDASDHISEVLHRVKKKYIQKTYQIDEWESAEGFLEALCRKSGRLLKGGEPDINTVAKMILTDYQRGRLPYFVPPPETEVGEDQKSEDQKPSDKKQTSEQCDKTNAALENVTTDTVTTETAIEKDLEKDLNENCVEPQITSSATHENITQPETKIISHENDIEHHLDELQEQGFKYQITSNNSILCVEALSNDDKEQTNKSKNNKRKKVNIKEPEETKRKKKEPRMTTNKMKTGKHYYESANVKNRNKNKSSNNQNKLQPGIKNKGKGKKVK
ncbi:uncharacterized protein LOC100211559 isoform X1 [Hydra vulgaris]|uniref:uncharacterized protein LOC100211559 isoform X1 n=1 Tax=Hydra vulgaris TaxID=6087 RepID=UPI001F5F8643|nr:nucleolar GTP-binding protein 2 [Hydra vulgaris]